MQCCTRRSPRVQRGEADCARGGFAKLDLHSTHNPSPVVVDERAITNSFEIGDDLEEAPRSTFYISKLYFRILLLSKKVGACICASHKPWCCNYFSNFNEKAFIYLENYISSKMLLVICFVIFLSSNLVCLSITVTVA